MKRKPAGGGASMDEGKVGRGEGTNGPREEVEEWASCEDGWVCVAAWD